MNGLLRQLLRHESPLSLRENHDLAPSSMPWSERLSLEGVLEDYVLITHAVPARRLKSLLPRGFELDSFKDSEGEERALISVASFYHRDLRPTATQFPSLRFFQTHYRTYVKYRGHRGLYFFGSFSETWPSYLGQKLTSRDAYRAHFETRIDSSSVKGYESYSFWAQSRFQTHFKISALKTPGAQAPFVSGEELTQFLTGRLHGFYKTPVIALVMDQVVFHPSMQPFAGELHEGHFELWKKLGVLNSIEMKVPYSVLVQPSIPFRFYPPFPALALRSMDQRELAHTDEGSGARENRSHLAESA